MWGCFTADLKNSLNLLIEINKQETTYVARSPVFLAYFLQQAKANNKAVTLRLASLAYNNAYKKILEQRCNVFRLILHSWRLRFLSQWASACLPHSEKSFPAKLSNETSFKMDSILICTRVICTFYTLFAVNNLERDWTLRYSHFSSMNKANPEKIWTTVWIFWISLAHIKAYFPTIRPKNKKDSKINPSLRPRLIIRENNQARNKLFQLPLIPTANQILWHCSNSQSALQPKSGCSECKLVRVCISPNFSGSRQRECVRTAKIEPDLRLWKSKPKRFLGLYTLIREPLKRSLSNACLKFKEHPKVN